MKVSPTVPLPIPAAGAAFCQALARGELPLFLPLPCHLVAAVILEYSRDFFATKEECFLHARADGHGFEVRVPLRKGDALQYRFRGLPADGCGEFYLNLPQGNPTFSLPIDAFCRPCPDPAEEVYRQLDAGRTVVLWPETPGDETPFVLLNLLGARPFQDALERGGELLRPADLQLLVTHPRRETFLETVGAGGFGRPTDFLLERFGDPLLLGVERFSYREINGADRLLEDVLQRFDAQYWFPLLGRLPLRCPESLPPVLPADRVGLFFQSWLDSLLYAGWLLGRGGS